MQVTQQYERVQNEAKIQMSKQLQRQYQIARPDATEAELENVAAMVAEGKALSVFQQQMISPEAVQLQAVTQRHEEIVQLEHSMESLFASFQDMQNILITNQQMLDSIESFMNHTVITIDMADAQVDDAIDYSKKAKKKRRLLWVLVVFLILLAILTLSIVTKK